MNTLKEKILNKKTLLSLIVGIIALYFLLTRLDFSELLRIIKQINVFYLALALFVYFLVFPILALRWQILLKNIGLKKGIKDLSEITIMQWFANCIVPAKLGDLYKGYLVKKNYKFPMSKTIGTIFVERLIDLIFLAIFLIILVWIVFKGVFPAVITVPAKILLILIVALIILVLIMRKKRKKIVKILPNKIKKIFSNFERGVSKCLKFKNLPLVSFYSFLQWLTQIMAVYLIVLAINLKITFPLVIFIALASALITAIPITPAGLGIGELAIAGILVVFNIEKNLAISASILIRFITYWCLLLVGGIVYIISSKK